MWTSVHLTVRVVLDLAEWQGTAVWQDDPDVDPVSISRSGTTRVHPYDAPQDVLQHCVDHLHLPGVSSEVSVPPASSST